MKNKITSDHCQSSGKTTATIKTATDFDLPNTTTKLYLNESLCPYYHILWSKKALFTMGKTRSYFISNVSVKICFQEKGPTIPITNTADFENYFPGVNLNAPR